MNNSWDVGQFFSVSILASDIGKAVQAAERLFKLKPPICFCALVKEILSDAVGNTLELEGEINGETLESFELILNQHQTEGVHKEADEIEEDYQQGRPEESVTAGGCTLTTSQSPDTEQKLRLQLNKLKQRTNMLLENLIQREREYQTLLQQTLQQKIQDLQLLQLQLNTHEIQPLSSALQYHIDEELIKSLKQQRTDSDAIDRFIQEDYTLSDVLNSITKED